MRLPDLSLAFRNIFRRPGFAIVAITLLALGAGANAAVFSVVRGVLLKPLAFPEPDRLVAVGPQFFISNEEMDYWRTRTRSFEHIAAISPGWMMGLVAEGGEPIKVTGGRVSDNMFQALGARAALGRTIEPGDAKPGAPQVAVISHGLWRARFNSDPHVIGRGIQLDEQPHAIVGVMPDGFEIFEPRQRPVVGAALGSRQPESQGDVLARRWRDSRAASRPKRRRAKSLDLAPAMRKDLGEGQRLGTDAARAVAAGIHHRRCAAGAVDPARRRGPDPDARGRESRHARARPIDRARRRDGAAHGVGRVTRPPGPPDRDRTGGAGHRGRDRRYRGRVPGDADPHRAHSRRSATAQRDHARLDSADDRAGRLGERGRCWWRSCRR